MDVMENENGLDLQTNDFIFELPWHIVDVCEKPLSP